MASRAAAADAAPTSDAALDANAGAGDVDYGIVDVSAINDIDNLLAASSISGDAGIFPPMLLSAADAAPRGIF